MNEFTPIPIPQNPFADLAHRVAQMEEAQRELVNLQKEVLGSLRLLTQTQQAHSRILEKLVAAHQEGLRRDS